MHIRYRDRKHAGEVLSNYLKDVQWSTKPLVLAIPNGGVAVGAEIAKRCSMDLDVVIVRKLQIPTEPEAGFGALTSFGTVLLNERLVSHLKLSAAEIDRVVARTKRQIEKRLSTYKGLAGVISPERRDVILVDDGLASGYTMLAAIESVYQQNPNQIIVAVPTTSGSAEKLIRTKVSEFLCPRVERGFLFAVANAYENWYDVPDHEAIETLKMFR